MLSSVELGEIYLAHVAVVKESLMHGEGSLEIQRNVAAVLLCEVHIIPEELLIHRMSAILDDGLCALQGILAAEVSHALLCDKNLY